MSEFVIASHDDDAGLRELLRIPMPGALSLSFEREPSFFLAASVEGDRHDTAILRDPDSGRIVAMGTRTVRDAWVNGERMRLGYLAQVRIDPRFRGRGVLRRAFARLKASHESDTTRLYVTTIIRDNKAARRALERDFPEKPHYQPRSQLSTLGLIVGRSQRARHIRGVSLRGGRPDDLEAIAACLQRNHRRYQFAPVWTAADLADLERSRGLRAEDFVIAERGGRVIGCGALWDQRAFKQIVVRGLAGPVAWLRPVYNRVAPIARLPRLPGIDEPIPLAFLAHLAADDDDVAVSLALIRAILDRASTQGLAFLTLGLCHRHPLLAPVKRAFRHFEYLANVYACHYPDADSIVATLDDRPAHLEAAVL